MEHGAPFNERPTVFTYEDYRVFLRNMYLHHKKDSASFSYRNFSERAGFKSPNFLKRVIDGERNLTIASIRKIVGGFKMTQEEGTFFRRLVAVNQAKTSGERNLAARELYKSAVFRELYPLKQAELDLYQQWYCIPIRELVAHDNFREDYAWIASQLNPAISSAEAKQAVEVLLSLGLISRDADRGLVLAQSNIATENEVHSAAVQAFHRQMLALASESIDRFARRQRVISGATVLVSETTFIKMKDLIQTFTQSLLAEAESKTDDAQAVYQISFQAFPLTGFISTKEKEDVLNSGSAACVKTG